MRKRLRSAWRCDLSLGLRPLDVRRRGLIDQRRDGLIRRHHRLPVAAESAHGNRMALGLLLADHEQRRDFRQRMLADRRGWKQIWIDCENGGAGTGRSKVLGPTMGL
jgi:hypothetical protein